MVRDLAVGEGLLAFIALPAGSGGCLGCLCRTEGCADCLHVPFFAILLDVPRRLGRLSDEMEIRARSRGKSSCHVAWLVMGLGR